MKYKNIEIDRIMIFTYKKEIFLPGDDELSVPPFDVSKDYELTSSGVKELLDEFNKLKGKGKDVTVAIFLSEFINYNGVNYAVDEVDSEEELLLNLSDYV